MNNRARVLVVDDNKTNLELFMDFLDYGGYEGLRAENGEEAIEIARKEHPDLVLLDMQLPGIDGLSVARILKSDEETKLIKVAVLSAYNVQKGREIFADEALDGYIAKPVSMKDFLKMVEELVGRI
ncbi:MAG: response regulator [Nitrospirae bacterium]|nr:response regulator [Nitrospirota bacterium]